MLELSSCVSTFVHALLSSILVWNSGPWTAQMTGTQHIIKQAYARCVQQFTNAAPSVSGFMFMALPARIGADANCETQEMEHHEFPLEASANIVAIVGFHGPLSSCSETLSETLFPCRDGCTGRCACFPAFHSFRLPLVSAGLDALRRCVDEIRSDMYINPCTALQQPLPLALRCRAEASGAAQETASGRGPATWAEL